VFVTETMRPRLKITTTTLLPLEVPKAKDTCNPWLNSLIELIALKLSQYKYALWNYLLKNMKLYENAGFLDVPKAKDT
jgi:hypothetical protein